LCETLLARGADVNSTTGRDRLTPLMQALMGSSAAESSETVAVLLQAGADIGVQNRHGTLALHLAVGRDASLDTIRVLLASVADAHVNTANNHGYTPSSVAKERGRSDVLDLLRAHGSRT
jgi:ankyrin repeat protein